MQVQPLADLLEGFGVPAAGSIASAVVFVVVFVLVYILGKAIVLPIVDRSLKSRDLDTHARQPLKKVVSIGIVFVAISVAFGMAEYGNFLQSLATIAAAATLAIGFAMQDVISNFVAGVFIYTDKPFRIGDWIEWDGNSGVVEDISLRVTRVRTFDNELLTVPNSNLTDGVIKNPVAKDQLRLKFVFGIDYDDDIDEATEIILDEAREHPEIMDDPEPSVRLVELGDSSVGLQSRIWIKNPSRSDFVKTRAEYVKSVKQRFDAEDINMPYPNRTIGGGLEMTGFDGVVEPADD
ncbi:MULTISPECIES: mechanosensitive ion channel family protein [Haloarcula]|jgi:small-conductance mechanosensitive channel|nr:MULTISPECIES: mechanosensitive ion channel family protein [Haloarcula]EMA16203.1 mechanosensitive ion channel MscS [Haloarcula sinaiiensis ATCC 33800]EMA26613.1 mechanosensitive ion channel MscS [Haloarcula californiae ATCC 33799]NHN65179.1 mechanosensitive ion channel family protein [Haloarcula sp. JP-Z28]NHX41251.1 mechanosensitive ion channel family protein [Haloarcula sp. R1-2]QCP93288.1 mechanosensitive ion channel family protein [Haloarcula marismortui ATCC 43049]